ncbi:MAG: hypothetical protein OEM97_09045 [Acidimicrobiia bacterium]|nr:hypothetical protein [Acidimicrobiia bacterium]
MNSPRLSILFWAIYEFALGVGLFLIPAQLTSLIGLAEPREVWIRVIGIALIGLGAFHLASTFGPNRWFYRASVAERVVAGVLLAYLAIVDGPWQLWVFAAATVLGAAWTFVALRNTGERALPDTAATPSAEAETPDVL